MENRSLLENLNSILYLPRAQISSDRIVHIRVSIARIFAEFRKGGKLFAVWEIRNSSGRWYLGFPGDYLSLSRFPYPSSPLTSVPPRFFSDTYV